MPYKLFTLTVFLILLIVLPLFSIADKSRNDNVSIKELTATTSETHLLLFGTLGDGITEEMVEVLHSGIPLKFTFHVELLKTDGQRPNEKIIDYSFEHRMVFDTLKESYQVTLEENNNRIQSFSSFVEAQNVMNEINGAEVVALSQLVPDNVYKLTVKAKLFEKTLPLSLQAVLPFLSWGNIETSANTIEFKY
ncbi:DUF4390 domain-containing protein [Desulforhopalus singaporensis]|uniref:DUF4390 domain-containing protein n=1 Tax=Desulforhopalus singaporensis TaxID=91360 RepID=A0A1H0MGM2_9BACT|nr:DUF4390 domain-containing protein [Desulforhopalus singaporensis]SDO79588.1 protein of unknown function [Desulforhopalus singaporensis]